MISIRRCWAIAAAACVVLGACTSQSAGDDDSASSATTASGSGATSAGATGTGNTVGITADTIKISLIATDLSQLAAQHLAPEIGNAGTTMQAVTDDINAKGGIAGRKVELIPHVLAGADAILNPDLGRQACVQATEDDKPFAVIIAAAIPASVVQCVANDHDVLTITMDSWPESLYTNAKGRLFSLGSHISIGSTQLYRAWPRILDDAGLLKGKKIGIIRQDIADQQEETDRVVEARDRRARVQGRGRSGAARARKVRRRAISTRSRSNACRMPASTSCSSSRRRSPVRRPSRPRRRSATSRSGRRSGTT